MTAKEILGKDFSEINKLSTKELRQATRTLADVANKRIGRLQERGLLPPALNQVLESGRTGFSTKGKNRNSLLNEFLNASNFLRAKGSTIPGAEKQKRTMGEKFKGELTDEQANKLWKAISRVRQLKNDSFLRQYMDSNQVVEIARRVILSDDIPETGDKDTDVDNLVKYLTNEVDRAYIEAQEQRPKHDYTALGKPNYNPTTERQRRTGKGRNKKGR